MRIAPALAFFLLAAITLLLPACVYQEKGCTDITALNYNPNAMADNGSCLYALPVPETYRFKRGDSTSVSYKEQVVLNLLIETICSAIQNLAEQDAQPIEIEQLTQIYQQTSYNGAIRSSTGSYTPAANTFTQIATGQRLSANVVNTYKADSMLLSWFDSIAVRSQNALYLGTPAVYTTASGFNMLAAVRVTLQASVSCANGVNLVKNISSNANNLLSGINNYTPMEHAWDKAWGFFGAATCWPAFDAESWSVQNFMDYDFNDTINFVSEYNFLYAGEAAQRDLISDPETDFSNTLFNAWVGGRTAITNKTDELRSAARQTILDEWERLIAATAIHYLNALKTDMTFLGTPDENTAKLNSDWTYLWAYLVNLRYFTTPKADVPDLLLLLGEAPLYALPDTEAYLLQMEKLQLVSAELQSGYGFTDFQMQHW
ncbi:DUF4856 domain-containing protein [Sphingobacteriales bacterium UPWRP_1]|nr:hypothetical protein B6N25_03655 [Sphingobacteriales bacterium TSM_CSS]PSJ73882.1 DUF4856 domain-containing protein [Sphingobacteriales bacterium UPWRP_1]